MEWLLVSLSRSLALPRQRAENKNQHINIERRAARSEWPEVKRAWPTKYENKSLKLCVCVCFYFQEKNNKNEKYLYGRTWLRSTNQMKCNTRTHTHTDARTRAPAKLPVNHYNSNIEQQQQQSHLVGWDRSLFDCNWGEGRGVAEDITNVEMHEHKQQAQAHNQTHFAVRQQCSIFSR